MKKSKIFKYILMAFAFIFSMFIVGNSNKVDALDINEKDESNVYVGEISYTYKQWSAITGLNEISVDEINFYYPSNTDLEYNSITFKFAIDSVSEITYSFGSYAIDIDTLDISNISYENDIFRYAGSTSSSTSNIYQAYITLYTSESNIFEKIASIDLSTTLFNILDTMFYEETGVQFTLDNNTIVNGSVGNEMYIYSLGNYDSVEQKSKTKLALQTRFYPVKYFEEDFIENLNIKFTLMNEYFVGSGGYTEEDLQNSYNQGLEDGKSSVDITTDNQEYAEQYIQDNNYHSNEEYLAYGEEQKQIGIDSVDITTDNQEYAEQYIQDNNYHSNEEYLAYGEEQKQMGIDSVDITTDNLAYAQNYISRNGYKSASEYQKYGIAKYDEGYEVGYSNGYTQGELSIDITSNDEEVITQYIIDNNMKTYSEYEEYGNKKYQIGMANADLTLDNELAIEKYIKDNNMKTEQELKEYGEEQYSLGKEYNKFGNKFKRFFDDIKDTLFGWIF